MSDDEDYLDDGDDGAMSDMDEYDVDAPNEPAPEAGAEEEDVEQQQEADWIRSKREEALQREEADFIRSKREEALQRDSCGIVWVDKLHHGVGQRR